MKTGDADESVDVTRVLRPFLEHGAMYLTTHELGRLLLFTSKNLTSEAGSFRRVGAANDASRDDGIWLWKMICRGHWRNEKELQVLLDSTQLSPEACFRHFGPQEPNASRPAPPPVVPPPLHSPDDYLLILHGSFPEGTEVASFCKTIPGSSIPEFFAKGKGVVVFDEPIQNVPYADGAEFEFEISLEVAIHLFRISDRKVLRVCESAQVVSASEESLPSFNDSEKCVIELQMDDDEYDVLERGGEITNFAAKHRILGYLGLPKRRGSIELLISSNPSYVYMKAGIMGNCIGLAALELSVLVHTWYGDDCVDYIRSPFQTWGQFPRVHFGHYLEAHPGWEAA